MTLLEAVLAANRARSEGDRDARAALAPGAMPFVITCMDPRIVGNLIPALGLDGTPPPQAKFAGGIVKAGDVSGIRSVLAAAIFNAATEVLIVGHTDCRMGKLSTGEIRSGLQRLGVRTEVFGGEDPARWLGVFASERSAVLASVEALRADPRMPPRMPVHGLIFHLESGRLELVRDGYAAASAAPSAAAGPALGGYRPGPATLEAPPSPVFGGTAPPLASPVAARGPVMLGAPGPVAPLSAPGSAGSLSFPAPPPFVPAPPPPVPVPPPMSPPTSASHQPASSFGESPPLSERPETQHLQVRDDRDPDAKPKVKTKPKRKPGGSSPFDRAQEVLDRLRRDEDR